MFKNFSNAKKILTVLKFFNSSKIILESLEIFLALLKI